MAGGNNIIFLIPDSLHLFSESTTGRLQEDLRHSSLSVLSCHLLCFPFALDLPSNTVSRILQLYASCGIVTGLLQVRAFLCSGIDLSDCCSTLMQQRITLAGCTHQAHNKS